MNTTPTIDATTSPTTPFVGWLGLDWGDKEHALCLFLHGMAQPESVTLQHSAENLHQWFQKLGERVGGQPVAVAIETKRGAVLQVLAQYPWITLYPINPLTSARYRQAFTPSGAKDDLPDAMILLDLVRFHAHKLRALVWEEENTRKLEALVQARRDAVDRRKQTVNQLRDLLKSYYPQALVLAGEDLSAPMALDLLGRWPDLLALKAARPATLRAFYYRHNVRREELIHQRVEQLKGMVALTTDAAVMDPAQLQLKLLLDVIKAFNRHIESFEAQIATTFKAHESRALFADLPGAGKALAPRLAVAFGTDRSRYPDASSFQKASGVAPVREKSGGQLWTHWRWQAPVFIRQSLVEWAGQTVIWSSWAKCYYERMKAKGKKHHVILRALAFKWVRILWKCWKTNTPYSEAAYLKALEKRKSPNLPPAAPTP
jgi:transposase